MKRNKIVSIIASLCLAGQMIPAETMTALEKKASAEFIYGDINSDSVADLTDLSLLSIYLMGGSEFTDIQKKAADVDGNDENDIRDLAHFKRYICKDKVTLGPQSSSLLKLKQASDYKDLYPLIKTTFNLSSDYNSVQYSTAPSNIAASGGGVPEAAVPDRIVQLESSPKTTGNDSVEHSDTHNQEENVLESDIVKTDGNTIYTISHDYYYDNSGSLKAVYVKDGQFEESQIIKIDLSDCKFGKVSQITTQNMYLYNDMIIVLGNAYIGNDTVKQKKEGELYYYSPSVEKSYTFVSAYKKGTKDKAPELIDTYYQEGRFNDVRITPDGYMYLITDGGFNRFYDFGYYNYSVAPATDSAVSENAGYNEEEMKEQIPKSGTNAEIAPVPLENIYVPENIDDTYTNSYTIVGSVDLNSSDSISQKDIKIITGYTGEIYCHENNLYLTHERYDSFYSKSRKRTFESSYEVTEITRLALSDGTVTPEATGEVPGYINDQFSMSEYEGNFRIVTTCNRYYYVYNENEGCYYDYIDKSERSNNVFVLDKDLNKIGEITHFAKDEMVKSVSFDGNIGYVVTFVQTDPLFAVDLSDPANPTILDEFKIDGFSTYMQKWDEGHLLGFGKTVTNNREDGYKIVMFDNSDPEDLKEAGIFEIHNTDTEKLAEIIGDSDFLSAEFDSNCWLDSEAAYERKALLIAPEKNLIGFPLYVESYPYYYSDLWDYKTMFSAYGYCFFSYEDGKFEFKNFLADTLKDDYYYYKCYDRALYIGDYVYIISNDKMMSADIDTCTKVDEIEFPNDTKDRIDLYPYMIN